MKKHFLVSMALISGVVAAAETTLFPQKGWYRNFDATGAYFVDLDVQMHCADATSIICAYHFNGSENSPSDTINETWIP